MWIIGGSSVSKAILCLLAGYLLLGVAHVAMLPLWEGIDETAHYSYLQQLTDRREVPRSNNARISRDVEASVQTTPLPYTFERSGSLTYEAFFAKSKERLERAKAFIHQRPEEQRRYAAGRAVNWEWQHPPLYYLALSPVYVATRHWSWAMHLFSLRLASYLFAWTALLIGVYACITAGPAALGAGRAASDWTGLGIGLWPLLLPSWFPDMARLGNDSLSALILACVWLVTIRAVHTGLSMGHALTLGTLLGLGCLTKMVFVPVIVACLGFWSFRAWKLGGRSALVPMMPRLAMMVLVIGVLAGWWYVWNWREYGVPVVIQDNVGLPQQGGLMKLLLERPHALVVWIKSHVAMGTTLVWPGTWSLVGPPLVYLAPMGFTMFLACGAYASALRGIRSTAVLWFPLWLAGLVLAGLSYQSLVRVMLLGRGLPGYYLHFLAVALGAALGLGLGTWWRKNAFRKVMVGCVTYAVLFGVGMSVAQIMLFSGLWSKSDEAQMWVYRAPDELAGVVGLPEALSRLMVLAYPWIGSVAWVLGGLFVLMGLSWSWKASLGFERAVESRSA